METGGLILYSVVKADPALVAAVTALGPVDAIIAPNLQHWIFIEKWAALYPDATLWFAEMSHGEDLRHKLSDVLNGHRGSIYDLKKNGVRFMHDVFGFRSDIILLITESCRIDY